MADKLRLEIIIDDKGTVVVKGLEGTTKKAFNDMERHAKKSATSMGESLKTVKAHWLAITAAMGGAVYAAKKCIDAASNLQEVHSKFNVVFEDQVGLATQWAKVLVDSYAMSRREAEQFLSSTQDLLKPMGMATAEAARMSNEIVKLSADLGSFNNLPTAQVMADIQSALVGNFETMKKYGVVLNATVVQEKALAMGLAKTKDELTFAHRAQAAYKLMVEGSKDAIGDMARTSDQYANTLKEMKAGTENVSAAMGNLLLPAARDLVSYLSDAAKYWSKLINLTNEYGNLSTRGPVVRLPMPKETVPDSKQWTHATSAMQQFTAAETAAWQGYDKLVNRMQLGQEGIDATAIAWENLAIQVEQGVAVSTASIDKMGETLEKFRNAEDAALQRDIQRWQEEIEMERQTAELKIQTRQNYLSAATAMANALYEGTGRQNKALFLLARAAAFAEAIVYAHVAAAKALAMTANPAYATSMLLLGYANAAVIAATTIGTLRGGGGPGGAPASTAAGTYPASPTTGAPEIGGGGPKIEVHIHGNVLGNEAAGQEIADWLNQAVEGYGTRLVASEVA